MKREQFDGLYNEAIAEKKELIQKLDGIRHHMGDLEDQMIRADTLCNNLLEELDECKYRIEELEEIEIEEPIK